MRIVNPAKVGEPRATVQRRDATKAVDVRDVNVCNIHYAEPPAISAPPREEAVTGPNGQPAEAAPSTPSKTNSPSTSKSEERHIRRRPEWTVESTAPHRSRPPRPRIAVIHPAPVVIGRPAPRLIANPSPAVVGLIDPIAIAVRSPVFRFIGHPDLPVFCCVFPTSVGVQVFGSNARLVS